MNSNKLYMYLICFISLSACELNWNRDQPHIWVAKKNDIVIEIIGEAHTKSTFKTLDIFNSSYLVSSIDALGVESTTSYMKQLYIHNNASIEKDLKTRIGSKLHDNLRREFAEEIDPITNKNFNILEMDKQSNMFIYFIVENMAFLKYYKNNNGNKIFANGKHDTPGNILYAAAININKPILELDTVDDLKKLGFACLDDYKLQTAIASIMEAYTDERYFNLFTEIPAMIANDKLEYIHALYTENKNYKHLKVFYDCVITPRNYQWLPRIIANSNNHKKVLYVVGAAHLLGSNGLLELLKKNDFSISKK